jgi:hypothetical protein
MDNLTIYVARAAISPAQWRAPLTPAVVRHMVDLYLRGHYPRQQFAVEVANSTVVIWLVASSQKEAVIAVHAGVVAAPSDARGRLSAHGKRVQRRLVAELTGLLDFTADMYVERGVQLALDRLDDSASPGRPRARRTVEYNGVAYEATVYTAHRIEDSELDVSVLRLPHGHLEILLEGRDVSYERAHDAALRTVANLCEQGLAVTLTSAVTMRES